MSGLESTDYLLVLPLVNSTVQFHKYELKTNGTNIHILRSFINSFIYFNSIVNNKDKCICL